MPLINRRIHQRILEKKRRLEALRPLSPSLVARLRKELAIEYTYDTNAIEGGTLTLRETRLVIEEGLTIGGKPLRDHLEARNHPEAISYIEEIAKANREIGEEDVLLTHGLVLKGVDESAGQYRASTVRIAGATFMPPPSSQIRPRIRELLEWLRDNPDELTPIELAALFHHRLVQIHPFNEGNGRTARLLMNAVLLNHGYPHITNITHRDRTRYLRTLSEADQGNPAPLVNLIARSVEHALDAYLRAIEEPEVLSLKEASRRTPYSQEYLSLLARRGAIGAFKRGRNWYTTKKDLERYLRTMEAKRRRNR
jgi:Fic family protein